MTIRNNYEVSLKNSSFGDMVKKACHHSRKIRFLRFFLPLSALIMVFVFCCFTFFSVPISSDTPILNNEENGIINLTMINPELEGYTSFYQPYWLKAKKAFPDHIRSGIIKLQDIIAEMPIRKQGHVFLTAQDGVYDNINGFLRLDKPFTVTINDEIIARFMAADINLSEGFFNTNQRLDIQREGFSLVANSLQIRERGQVLYFQDGVHLVFDKH